MRRRSQPPKGMLPLTKFLVIIWCIAFVVVVITSYIVLEQTGLPP